MALQGISIKMRGNRNPAPSVLIMHVVCPTYVRRGSDIRGDGKVKDRGVDGGHHPHQGTSPSSSSSDRKKQPHVKKPLNAFMLYMKEMRAKVVAECTLKESAAINQILGRRVRRSDGFPLFLWWDGNGKLMVPLNCLLVACVESRRAEQVLRAGSEGKGTAYADVPWMDCQGELRCQNVQEEKAQRQSQ